MSQTCPVQKIIDTIQFSLSEGTFLTIPKAPTLTIPDSTQVTILLVKIKMPFKIIKLKFG